MNSQAIEVAPVPSVVPDTLEVVPATAASASVESGVPVLPMVISQTETTGAALALVGADDALKAISLYSTWENAIGRMKWVMESVSSIA